MTTKKITKNTNTSSETSIFKKENSNKVNKIQSENLIKKINLNSSYNAIDPKNLKKENLKKTNLINTSRDKNSTITNKLNSTLNETLISKRGINDNQNMKKNSLHVRNFTVKIIKKLKF